jgi:hypothetical protein
MPNARWNDPAARPPSTAARKYHAGKDRKTQKITHFQYSIGITDPAFKVEMVKVTVMPGYGNRSRSFSQPPSGEGPDKVTREKVAKVKIRWRPKKPTNNQPPFSSRRGGRRERARENEKGEDDDSHGSDTTSDSEEEEEDVDDGEFEAREKTVVERRRRKPATSKEKADANYRAAARKRNEDVWKM